MVRVARADAVSIDISGLVNSDLTAYSGGGSYPQHGGPLIVAGVPFTLATIGPHSDTGVIQSSTDGGVPQTYSLAVGLYGVGSAFALVKTAFGTCGASFGELAFIGSTRAFSYVMR